MIKSNQYHIVLLLSIVMLPSCLSQMEIFETEAPDDGLDHIGNFYSTSIFEDHMSDEVWFSEFAQCINVESQTEHVYSGEAALHVIWDKGASSACDWIGMGIGWDGWSGKNMGSIYDHAAIRFRAKTEGKPLKSLPMAIALECYDGGSAWVGFSRKMIQGGEIGNEWTDIIIPILAFNWKEMDADITIVKQLMMEFQANGDLYLDDFEVIEWDGSLRSRGAIHIKDEMADLPDMEGLPAKSVFVLENNKIVLSMDSEKLYITADITDDTPLENSNNDKDIWNGDAIEIAFSTDLEAPLGRNFYLTTDKHIGIRVSDEPIVWDWRNHHKLSNCEVSTKITANGYTLTASIPLGELSVDALEENSIYGLEIAIDQGDVKGRNVQMRWNSPDVEGFHTNPSLWGEARIVKN